MTQVLLRRVRLLDPETQTDRVTDVLLADGQIQTIADSLPLEPNRQEMACNGFVLGPGLVDLYSHSGEPGFEDRETLASLLAAGLAGGFTRLTLLPDTQPTIDNPASLTALHQKHQSLATQTSPLPALSCWASLTIDGKGQQMAELGELAEWGAIGFADGKPLSNLVLVRRLLEYLNPLGKPVALWPCHPDLVGNGVMREGSASLRIGLPGNPAFTETSALAALLELIEAIGTPVHLMRISTARSVDLIRTAKSRGLPITASTSWLHLILNTEALQSYHPALHLAPPLGNPGDQDALIQGVKDGTLDVIAIDHTPYTYEEKTVAFAEAPPGAIGLEFALPLLWQSLVRPGLLTPLELWTALSLRPTQCLQQSPGTIAPGQKAELALFNPDQPWVVRASTLHSLARNTSWLGQEIQGKVVQVWC
ncbi:MAG: dihydroorotase [Leptolyngbyaceae cyanobacterium bins.59]|nr:dihydroorotase [Leptolyngbyaceae cyanobacterium bins.59]